MKRSWNRGEKVCYGECKSISSSTRPEKRSTQGGEKYIKRSEGVCVCDLCSNGIREISLVGNAWFKRSFGQIAVAYFSSINSPDTTHLSKK